ncbi:MAG TPA: VOC family protein [Solirubrobacteraceae bacterium]|jgi:catechol-2,3-dioxygenase
MNRPVISAMGHVAIVAADLEAAVQNATTIMGLRVSERREDGVDLTHCATHHSLQYLAGETDALHHIGLVAADSDALHEIHARAGDAGFQIVREKPFDDTIPEGFVLAGPEGFQFEIYRGMPEEQPVYTPTGVKPTRFGHLNVTLGEPAAMRDFLRQVLDFRITDDVAGGFFMRCNVDHHGLGVFQGPPALNHYAWEVQSTVELGQLGDRLDEIGESLLYGPVRHGAGNNIAAYYTEPSGAVVEYYCDMERIYDEASYKPPAWDFDSHKWMSRWAPFVPADFLSLGVPRVDGRHDLAATSATPITAA